MATACLSAMRAEVFVALLRFRAALYPQIVESIVDIARLIMRGLAHEPAGRHNLVHDKSRHVRGEVHLLLVGELVHNVVEDFVRQRHPLLLALLREDSLEILQGWRSHFDLVGQAAQECRIHQVLGLQVG